MKLRRSIMNMILSLAVVLSGMFAFSTGVFAAEPADAEITEEEFARLVKEQEAAVNANEVLMESFLVDDVIVYPEEFAGNYIEDNRLVIELTCEDEAARQKYEELLKDFDCVEYRIVEHSYDFLYHLANDILEQMKEVYPVTKAYVDVINNIACVEIADGREEEAAAQYSLMRNNHSDCISFKPGDYAQVQT